MEPSQFIKCFPKFYLQTFDDSVEKRRELTWCGKPSETSEKALRTLNLGGAGVFFTPNQFTKSRKAEFCEGINSWFFEIDNLSLDEQWDKITKAPLMPSLIVKTKKSFHCYYLADKGTIRNFRRVQMGLIKYFDSDPACKDCSRVLRIPGFFHMKDPANPTMVEIVWEAANYYTENEMLAAFPHEEVEVQKSAKATIVEGMKFWEAVSNLESKTVLERLSGTFAGNFDSITFRPRPGGGEYIDVNGKAADAWLDVNGRIGSSHGGGPTFVQWLEYYKWSKADIASWVKENCKDLLPASALDDLDKENVDLTASEISFDKILNAKKDLTWGVSNLDEQLTPLGRKRYMVLVGETGAGKTAFAFQMALKNAELGHRVLYLSLEMNNDSLLVRYILRKLEISKLDWKKGKFKAEDFEDMKKSLPATFFFKAMESVDSVTSDLVVKIVKEGNYDMVFIDNFGFIESSGADQNEQVKNLSRTMVKLKNNVDTCIVALHHFRKNTGQTKRGIDSILGSGKIAHDVDFAVQVMRTPDLEEDSPAEDKAKLLVCLMKDRDFGDTATIPVYYLNGEFKSTYYGQTSDVSVHRGAGKPEGSSRDSFQER